MGLLSSLHCCQHVIFCLLIVLLFSFVFHLIIYFVFTIQVPVGRATLGRIINVIGEAIDEKGELSKRIRNLEVSSNQGFK